MFDPSQMLCNELSSGPNLKKSESHKEAMNKLEHGQNDEVEHKVVPFNVRHLSQEQVDLGSISFSQMLAGLRAQDESVPIAKADE